MRRNSNTFAKWIALAIVLLGLLFISIYTCRVMDTNKVPPNDIRVAENISIELIAVFWEPFDGFSWSGERAQLKLIDKEKQTLIQNDIKGRYKVMNWLQRGSSPHHQRIVILQGTPLSQSVALPIWSGESSIFLQKESQFQRLPSEGIPSNLTVELTQEKDVTSFYVDLPTEGIRTGGGLFFWGNDGRPEGIRGTDSERQ